MKLKFSYRNSKMRELAENLGLPYNTVASFDLPAGHTCPAASLCLSFADRITGRITDGADSQFRCYAASTESAFTNARLLHWFNYDLLLESGDFYKIINASLPEKLRVLRIHSSGDFFHKDYFKAWVRIAEENPQIDFFGYTKILPYVSYPKSDNFGLVYSLGGKMDSKVTTEPVSRVVYTSDLASEYGLEVACSHENHTDDFQRIMRGESFALALHGTQKAGGATMK